MRRLSELGGKRIPFLRWVEYQSLLKDLVLESEYLGR